MAVPTTPPRIVDDHSALPLLNRMGVPDVHLELNTVLSMAETAKKGVELAIVKEVLAETIDMITFSNVHAREALDDRARDEVASILEGDGPDERQVERAVRSGSGRSAGDAERGCGAMKRGENASTCRCSF